MKNRIFDGEIIEQNGRKFRVDIERYDHIGEPWREHDGHGIVSEWTRRDKKPGELVMNKNHGLTRFYDFDETLKLARRDGWGLSTENVDALSARIGRPATSREIIAESVRRDFEHLRAWCNDDWYWCGVIVTDITDDKNKKPDYVHALWGIESTDCEYHFEVASELVDEILSECQEVVNKARRRYHQKNVDALALIREIKKAGATFTPAICLALRDQLADMLESRSTCLSVITTNSGR